MKSFYPFAWRILLWSTVGFLSANAVMLGLFFIPDMAGGYASNAPNVTKYGLGPVIASVAGFLGGVALGIWLSIRAKAKSTLIPSLNSAPGASS